MRYVIFVFFLFGMSACRLARQAATITVTETVTVTDTVRIEVPVPTWVDAGTIILPDSSLFDSFFLDMENSWAEVVVQHDTVFKERKYRVRTGNKADTIFFERVITDTVEVDCPPILIPVPADGRFPWALLFALVGGLLVYFANKKRKKDIS